MVVVFASTSALRWTGAFFQNFLLVLFRFLVELPCRWQGSYIIKSTNLVFEKFLVYLELMVSNWFFLNKKKGHLIIFHCWTNNKACAYTHKHTHMRTYVKLRAEWLMLSWKCRRLSGQSESLLSRSHIIRAAAGKVSAGSLNPCSITEAASS